MTIRFFKNINSQQELRKAFVILLKKYHPDNGGTTADCQALNAEYEYLMKQLPKEATQSQAEKKAAADLDKEIRQAVEKIIHLDGLNIEIVGTWIWIDGNTYPHRETLKANGYRWSKARKKWHFTPYDEGGYYKGKKKAFDVLRKQYGSTFIDLDPAPLLT